MIIEAPSDPILLAKDLYKICLDHCEDFGALHIAISDGNVEDEYLDFCYQQTRTEPRYRSDWPNAIANYCFITALRQLSELERLRVMDFPDYYLDDDDEEDAAAPVCAP